MAKAMMMCVLDVGKSMSDSCSRASHETKLSVGLAFTKSQVTHMMMNSKTFEFGMVTFGDDDTRNYLNDESGTCNGVREIISMGRTNSVMIKNISESVYGGSNEGHIDDGLEVGYGILSTINAAKKFNKILLLITDGETPLDEDRFSHLNQIIEMMSGTADPRLDPCSCFVILVGSVTLDSSTVKNENAQLFKSMSQITQGRYIEVDELGDCFPIFSSIRGVTTIPRPANIAFELSPLLRLPCYYWSQVAKSSLPTLKKQVKSVGNTVKRDTSYRNPDDPDEEVIAGERVKGYQYGSQYVPISAAEEEAFKISGPQVCQLLGFFQKDQIPRYHFVDSTNVLQARGEAAQTGLAALIQALRNQNQVALVRFVKKDDSDPYLAALVPPSGTLGDADLSQDLSSLLILRLPTSDDKRDYAFPPLPLDTFVAVNGKPGGASSDQAMAMSAFVDSLTVSSPAPAQLTPFNSTLKQLVSTIGSKLERSEDAVFVPLIPPAHFVDPLQNLSSLSMQRPVRDFNPDITAAALRGVAATFDLKVNEKSKEKKRSYWSDIQIDAEDTKKGKGSSGQAQITVTEGASFGSSSVHVKSEAGASSSSSTSSSVSAAAYSGPTLSAGSVSPAEDFERVAAYCADPTLPPAALLLAEEALRAAMDTMGEAVTKLLCVGGTGAHYRKASTCIRSYRSAAVLMGEHTRFNAFLCNFKSTYSILGNRHRAAWDLIVRDGLTLVSTQEDSGSTVTPSEAKAFLEERVVEAVAELKVDEVEEEGDMFDDMA